MGLLTRPLWRHQALGIKQLSRNRPEFEPQSYEATKKSARRRPSLPPSRNATARQGATDGSFGARGGRTDFVSLHLRGENFSSELHQASGGSPDALCMMRSL